MKTEHLKYKRRAVQKSRARQTKHSDEFDSNNMNMLYMLIPYARTLGQPWKRRSAPLQ
jgi:hypothetical protein